MEYQVKAGKVQTRALELHVADHCNLRCDHCCSFSPILPKWFADPVVFADDLEKARRVIAPQFLKVVGGEPLLHPELERLLVCAKEKAVAPRVQLTTNGFLLKRLTTRAWESIDALTVSLYPQPALPKTLIRSIAREAALRNVEVNWKVQDKFSCLDRKEWATYDEAKRIFGDCWIRHRCHSMKEGRFYSCTRPQYVQKFASNPYLFLQDGVSLKNSDDSLLLQQVRAHLEATEPLRSCYLCQGGHASLSANRQLTPIEVRSKREQLTRITLEA